MSRFDDIKKLHERGLSVIPLQPESKLPIGEWKTYQSKRATADEVDAWWDGPDVQDRNVGIVTGAISGVVVLDIDGGRGLDALGDLPDTPIVRTGKGYHVYFKHPGFPVGNC